MWYCSGNVMVMWSSEGTLQYLSLHLHKVISLYMCGLLILFTVSVVCCCVDITCPFDITLKVDPSQKLHSSTSLCQSQVHRNSFITMVTHGSSD